MDDTVTEGQEAMPTQGGEAAYESVEVPPPAPEQKPADMYEKKEPSNAHDQPKRGSFIGFIGTIAFYLLLFIIGVFLSIFLRQYAAQKTGLLDQVKIPELLKKEPVIKEEDKEEVLPTETVPEEARWVAYGVISGINKQPFEGLVFKLPESVLEPICDGSACASQGTYLPGGTRFTTALRGENQVLEDFRNAVISDLEGQAFNTEEKTVSGLPAVEYFGEFEGTTAGGYVFSRMRGFMIELNEATSLEVNHFASVGIDADFESDDVLFDEIIMTILYSQAPPLLQKGEEIED